MATQFGGLRDEMATVISSHSLPRFRPKVLADRAKEFWKPRAELWIFPTRNGG
jgi:hypothetical protein